MVKTAHPKQFPLLFNIQHKNPSDKYWDALSNTIPTVPIVLAFFQVDAELGMPIRCLSGNPL